LPVILPAVAGRSWRRRGPG